MIKLSLSILFLSFSFALMAQNEHNQLISANEAYKKGKFKEAAKQYLEVLNQNVNSLKGNYNLGNVKYQEEKYDEAIAHYQLAASNAQEREVRAKAYHNLGNAYFQGKKYKEAVEAYKQALRDNPQDYDTKNNLALAQKIVNQQKKEEQKKQQQQKKQEQDPNKENEQENQNQQSGQNQQQEEEDKKQKQGQEKDQPIDNEPEDEKEGKKPEELSKDDVERLMQIIENEDKKVQEKLMKRQKGRRKKPEKDW